MQFEEWIRFIFLQPVDGQEPTNDAEWDIFASSWPVLEQATIVAYMTQIFEHADSLLSSFSNAQLAQGFDRLINPSFTNDIFALREEAVPLADRLRAIQAMPTLFRNCLAHRCAPNLYLESGVNPLNTTCYMWWDILPIHGLIRHQAKRADSAALDQACLDALMDILEIDSPACQESALYGLHIWSLYYPVQSIIDNFLARHPYLSPGYNSMQSW